MHSILRSVIVLFLLPIVAGCGSPPVERPVPQPGGAPASAPTSDGGSARGQTVVIDVAGAVREPGVYELDSRARIHEAIEAAGGLARNADASTLNRASEVVDGQQVLVPVQGEAPVASAGSGGAAPGAGGASVSINSADAAALEQLPGVGPVTAANIVAERESGGPFTSVDDLERVSGIGPATIEGLREAATT
jgi:competence protein ComEA